MLMKTNELVILIVFGCTGHSEVGGTAGRSKRSQRSQAPAMTVRARRGEVKSSLQRFQRLPSQRIVSIKGRCRPGIFDTKLSEDGYTI